MTQFLNRPSRCVLMCLVVAFINAGHHASAAKRITGQVRLPNGSPAAGARVQLIGLGAPRDAFAHFQMNVLNQSKCNEQGQFDLSASEVDFALCAFTWVLAAGDQSGLAWHRLRRSGKQPPVSIALPEAHDARGRLVTSEGVPASGVTVHVESITRVNANEPDGVGGFTTMSSSELIPKPAVTDDDGNFVVSGIPPDVQVEFVVDQAPYVKSNWRWKADEPNSHTHVLVAAERIAGRALAADTGKPLEGAAYSIAWFRSLSSSSAIGTSDQQGQFSGRVHPEGPYNILVRASAGSPYLWGTGRLEAKFPNRFEPLDIEVPRGVLMNGQVIEMPGAKPIAAAKITYWARDDNEQARSMPGMVRLTAESGADGRFVMAVPHGKGHLTVQSPFAEHVIQEISRGDIVSGKPGERRMYVHGHTALDLSRDVDGRDVQISVQRGTVARGNAVAPDGQSPDRLVLAYRGVAAARTAAFYEGLPDEVIGGEFEINGMPREGEVTAFVLDPIRKMGRSVKVRGQEAGKPLTLELQPCGSLTLRYVDEDRDPIAGHKPDLMMEFTSGVSLILNVESTDVWADEDNIENFDVLNCRALLTDEDGRITYPTLIPGVTYRLLKTADSGGFEQVREMRVAPGEVVTMPDQIIKNADVIERAAMQWQAKQAAATDR